MDVSIHASRFREAMRETGDQNNDITSSFNPRLPFPGGDAAGFWPVGASDEGFNPRLPFPGGDALNQSQATELKRGVSIHASRFREAMPLDVARHTDVNPVSIHASRFREAMPERAVDACQARLVSIHASRFREAMPV